ncbi:MAG: hypothetical protein R3E53_08110 [Myxococcota bacterium]
MGALVVEDRLAGATEVDVLVQEALTVSVDEEAAAQLVRRKERQADVARLHADRLAADCQA